MIDEQMNVDAVKKRRQSIRPSSTIYVDNLALPKTVKKDEVIVESNVSGLEITKKLIEKYEQDYTRKFKFDKAQYHQCIPNPSDSNEFITV